MIVEIDPAAYPKMGTSLAELAAFTEEFGYTPYCVETRRKVDLRKLKTTTDVLFIHPSNGL